MKYEFFDTPVPHIIIDDFLNPRSARDILDEIIKLEPFYEDAKVKGHETNASHIDECEECKINNVNLRNMIRDNKILYLDKTFENKRNQSKTLTYLHFAITDNPEFKMIMEKSPSIFPILSHLNTSETLVSRYGKCDFYGWHTDSIPNITENRVLTISYYVNKEPNVFKGGSLIFLNNQTKEKKIIEPKHNRAVIFSSMDAFHSVEYVDLAGKNWEDGRFSIQFWLGFNNHFKFR